MSEQSGVSVGDVSEQGGMNVGDVSEQSRVDVRDRQGLPAPNVAAREANRAV
ncbi:hypothetical protein ACFFX1_47720 [Dactylosporangium sucinum]|uniref:hypothetical protein n=1 Tax=Dactylosporangium sucinum TaxID=1424081 RepID=UPI00167EC5F2